MRISPKDATLVTREILDGKPPVVYAIFRKYDDPKEFFIEKLTVTSVTLRAGQGVLVGDITARSASLAEYTSTQYTLQIDSVFGGSVGVFTDETETDALIEASKKIGVRLVKRYQNSATK